MAQWLYKVTKSRLDAPGVIVLADKRGFFCRSAYEEKTRGWADNVQHVAISDVINFYYVHRTDKVSELGAFEVIPRERHPKPERFGERVDGSALYVVDDDAFLRQIDTQEAYRPDPVVGKFTGWLLHRVGKAPKYDPKMFPGMGTLVRSATG